jgi:rhodanese-related sulfurtransferase
MWQLMGGAAAAGADDALAEHGQEPIGVQVPDVFGRQTGDGRWACPLSAAVMAVLLVGGACRQVEHGLSYSLLNLSIGYLNSLLGGSLMTDRAAKTALFDEFARVGKALGSGRRIELLDVLANGERTVEGLAGEVGLSVANTSQHLQVLRQAGLITGRRQGTSIRYRLAAPEVFGLWRALRTLAAARLAEVERLAAAYLGAREELEPVTRQELARRLQDGDPLVVLDVRPPAEHAAGHLPGAVSIPLAELRRRLAELPGEREIVAYCRGPYCAFAHEAVRVLGEAGLAARRLEDGLPEWQAAGLPVVAS